MDSKHLRSQSEAESDSYRRSANLAVEGVDVEPIQAASGVAPLQTDSSLSLPRDLWIPSLLPEVTILRYVERLSLSQRAEFYDQLWCFFTPASFSGRLCLNQGSGLAATEWAVSCTAFLRQDQENARVLRHLINWRTIRSPEWVNRLELDEMTLEQRCITLALYGSSGRLEGGVHMYPYRGMTVDAHIEHRVGEVGADVLSVGLTPSKREAGLLARMYLIKFMLLLSSVSYLPGAKAQTTYMPALPDLSSLLHYGEDAFKATSCFMLVVSVLLGFVLGEMFSTWLRYTITMTTLKTVYWLLCLPFKLIVWVVLSYIDVVASVAIAGSKSLLRFHDALLGLFGLKAWIASRVKWMKRVDLMIPRAGDNMQWQPRLNFGGTVNEMSMNGSIFVPTKLERCMAVILTENYEEAEFDHLGFCFRYGEYLFTAQHVWNRAESTPGKVYIAPLKFGKGTMVPDLESLQEITGRHNVLDDLPDEMEGLSQTYDVAMFHFSNAFFTKLGLTSAKFEQVADGSPVDAFGYFPPSIKRSSGSSVASDEPAKVYYTASTRDGSSGCPIFMGRKVVAMHQGVSTTQKNRGLAATVLELLVKLHSKTRNESPGAGRDVFRDRDNIFRDRRGRRVEVFQEDFGFVFVDTKGRRTALTREDVGDFETIRDDLEHKGHRFESASSIQTLKVKATPIVEIPNDEISQLAVPVAPTKSPRDSTFLSGTPLEEAPELEKNLKPPAFKGFDVKTTNLFNDLAAEKLGFDSKAFAFPVTSGVSVFNSFKLHTRILSSSRSRLKPPADEVRCSAKKFVSRMLSKASFQAKKDPLSDENIDRIINSTLIQESKSPGRFFSTHGMKTNGDVLERYSNLRLAQMVRDLSSLPEDINVFPKIDNEKKQKLEEGRIRLISGVDLRETILAQAYLDPLNEKLAASYKDLPTMVGWSPLKAGDGEWFAERFTRKKKNQRAFFSSDIKSFDWCGYHAWNVEDLAKILCSLSRRDAKMSDDEFTQWKVDFKEVVVRQFTMPLVLPDGRRFLRKEPTVMSSGSVLTLAANSIMMFYLDTCAKLTMGYTLSQLESDFTLAFGGDDGLQSCPCDFNISEYTKVLSSFGLDVHDMELKESFYDCEFFSWSFTKSKDGSIEWRPVRFSKHCANIKAVLYDVLPDALRSAMINWAHDADRFRFFEQLYLDGQAHDPQHFSLSYPNRSDIIDRLNGLE